MFKIGNNMVVQPVKSIGRRALFVGNCRCLSVDADKFAAVDANSIYYIEYMSYDVRVYSLSDGTELCSGGAIGSSTFFSSNDSPPFSVVQLLGCYAYEIRSSELGLELEQMLARAFSTLDEITFDVLGKMLTLSVKLMNETFGVSGMHALLSYKVPFPLY
jgi:hypothetical protein